MNYEELKNVLLALMEDAVINNPQYYGSLSTLYGIVEKEEEYRKQVAMLMGERWVERYMNEDRTNRC